MLHMPDDSNTRWMIKNLKGSEMILIVEQKVDGSVVHELRSRNLFEQEVLLAEPIAPSLEVREVIGYDNRFMVSEAGDLISKKSNKVLSLTKGESGYLCHATKIGGREGKDVLLRSHRLVAETFIENPDNKPFVNHDDGIKTNNRRENLEWVTSSENAIHAFANGLAISKAGCEAPSAKLNEEEVRALRTLQGKVSSRNAGKEFGVDHSTVLELWKGRSYSSVV